MSSKAILIKENAVSDTVVYIDNNMNKLVETSKLKVEFFQDRDYEKEAYDIENGPHNEVEDTKVLDTQQTDLQDYQLARNKVTRYIKSHVRYNYADLITFTLMSVDDIIVKEHKNQTKVIKINKYKKWHEVMQEEIDSLLKKSMLILLC